MSTLSPSLLTRPNGPELPQWLLHSMYAAAVGIRPNVPQSWRTTLDPLSEPWHPSWPRPPKQMTPRICIHGRVWLRWVCPTIWTLPIFLMVAGSLRLLLDPRGQLCILSCDRTGVLQPPSTIHLGPRQGLRLSTRTGCRVSHRMGTYDQHLKCARPTVLVTYAH